jgi:hypothetical protein
MSLSYSNSSICQIFKRFKAKACLQLGNLDYLKDPTKKKFMKVNRALIRKKLQELTNMLIETNQYLNIIAQLELIQQCQTDSDIFFTIFMIHML